MISFFDFVAEGWKLGLAGFSGSFDAIGYLEAQAEKMQSIVLSAVILLWIACRMLRKPQKVEAA
ncbi:MAG: hypothetical protein AAF557_22135 [Pseudomonadota bacterium]